ncbi:hypothetical protein, partial [Salmonella sp. SAL4432]|uniref:hypothetical protein n=1 Tax=Salmonella sp. SAL4432 TaxID=3159887 RepID=UPI0039787AD5
TKVFLALVITLAIFLGLIYIGGNRLGIESLQTGENPLLRFVFVIVGLLIVFAVYWFTRENKIWEVGTREVVYMAIGAALYAIFSFIFN